MYDLREDQAEAMESLRQAAAEGHKRICMQAPTGWGKTRLAGAIVESALAKGKRVLFTVPALSLIDQTVQMFNLQGIYEIGVIQANNRMTDSTQPVQVASVQTLMKRDKLQETDIVLLDECHRWFTVYKDWLSQDGWKCLVIGLSATPWTKGLGNVYRGPWGKPKDERKQCRIVAATTQELIDKGLLSDFKVYAPSHPDLSGVRTVAGDYHEGELAKQMQKGELVADAVDTWLRLGENRSTLCFAVDRAHAKTLQMKFEASGVKCGYQDAFTKESERAALKQAFHAGDVRVVCNVGTLTTGIDWDVRCISMCRPTQSDMLFVQIVGRGLRTAEGKDHCLILDHSDNHQRLGFVTDIDASYTALKEDKSPQHDNRTAGIRLPKECPKCAYLRSPKVSVCPQCGFKAEMVSNTKHEDGDLRELKRAPKAAEEISNSTFYSELKAFALLKGYNPGWVEHKYREKYGRWAPAAFKALAPAGTVSATTRGFITSRRIAYLHRPSQSVAAGGMKLL